MGLGKALAGWRSEHGASAAALKALRFRAASGALKALRFRAASGAPRAWTVGPPSAALRSLRFGAFARGALDLLLPPQPFAPGERDDGRPLTPGLGAQAWGGVRFLDAPVCDGCGSPFAYDLGRHVRCAACLAAPRRFDRARAACVYDERSAALILPFKHGDRTELGGLFARWLQRSAADLLAECDAVAPVPLHPSRLRKRRYNQAAEVARPLARLGRRPYWPEALVRAKPTTTQGGKSGRGRRENVRSAFSAPNPQRLKGKRILLVDDVLTTGATLDACALALKRAGAVEVFAAVIARVERGRSEFD